MKRLFLIIIFISGFISLSAQSVSVLPQSALWYRSENVNDTLLYINDNSGNNVHAHFPQNYQFMYNTFNFHTCLEIDSAISVVISDYGIKESCELTIFSVFKATNSNTASGIWELRLDSAVSISMGNQYLKDVHETNIFSDSLILRPVVNLFRYKWKFQNVDSSVSHLQILGNDSLGFSGKFAEFLLFDTTLSVSDLAKVHTYLGIKFGIGIENLNYVNSLGEIIWNYKDNIEYANEIAGIGQDSLLLVSQKQSGAMGGESILTISAGNLTVLNTDNNTVVNELDFLIWGDNGKNIVDFYSDSIGTEYIQNVSQRKWLMACSGNTSRQINTNLRINIPDVDDSLTVFLLINNNADFGFPMSSTQIIYPDSTDDSGNFYYTNIVWDSDSSGTDAFSFQMDSMWTWGGRNQNTQLLPNQDQTSGSGSIESLRVFPNPSNGYYTAEVILNDVSDVRLTIFDDNSKLISSRLFPHSTSFVFTGFIQGKGTYMLVFDTPSERKNIKLIVN